MRRNHWCIMMVNTEHCCLNPFLNVFNSEASSFLLGEDLIIWCSQRETVFILLLHRMGWQTLSYEGPDCKCFRFCRSHDLVADALFFSTTLSKCTDHFQHASHTESGCLPNQAAVCRPLIWKKSNSQLLTLHPNSLLLVSTLNNFR